MCNALKYHWVGAWVLPHAIGCRVKALNLNVMRGVKTKSHCKYHVVKTFNTPGVHMKICFFCEPPHFLFQTGENGNRTKRGNKKLTGLQLPP